MKRAHILEAAGAAVLKDRNIDLAGYAACGGELAEKAEASARPKIFTSDVSLYAPHCNRADGKCDKRNSAYCRSAGLCVVSPRPKD